MEIKDRVLTLCVAALLIGTVAQADDERRFEVHESAAGLDEIRIEARVGELELERSDDDTLRIEVTLEPDDDDGGWFGDDDQALEIIAESDFEYRTSGSTARARIDYPRREHDMDVQERWTIYVPERFRVDIKMNVGSASVRDVAGGVELDLNVGEVRIEVPEGSVNSHVNVGEIYVESGSTDVGRAELSANVGDVSMSIRGDRIRSDDRGWGPGEDLDYDGDGRDDFDLSVNVGDVRLRIR